jgi:hypothetical protein
VAPDKLAKLSESYLEQIWNLAGYVVKVTMFHSFSNSVFKCVSLPTVHSRAGHHNSKDRGSKVLQNIRTQHITTWCHNPEDEGRKVL